MERERRDIGDIVDDFIQAVEIDQTHDIEARPFGPERSHRLHTSGRPRVDKQNVRGVEGEVVTFVRKLGDDHPLEFSIVGEDGDAHLRPFKRRPGLAASSNCENDKGACRGARSGSDLVVWPFMQAREVVAHWRKQPPPALAVGLVVDRSGIPTHRWDDPRAGRWVETIIASDEHFAVIPVDPSSLEFISRWLSGPQAPYLVFDDAHAALWRWRACHGEPFEPARFGCLRIATALLMEGTRPYRDLPSVDRLVESLLGESFSLRAAGHAHDHAVAGERAQAMLKAMKMLTPKLRKRQLVNVHHLECSVVPAVVDMEIAGIGVDGAALARLAQTWSVERASTTDAQRIARLDKLISTYGYWPQEFVREDRIHAHLHPMATDSGRFSCTDPNLQQVPSEATAPGMRACFRPAPGHALIVADYAQIELRVAAHIAECPALRRVFETGKDPHRVMAATMTGKPENEISHHERQLAKAVNFGFLFGMGARRFASYARDAYGVEVDEAEAQQARASFLSTFDGVGRWHARVGLLGRQRSEVTVRTVMGRRKRFAKRFSFNAALNIPVQGTAAEGFKLAMARLLPRLRALGGRGVLCVHDEYLAEVPRERAEEARLIVQETMESAMHELVTSVPIVAEAVIAESWADKA